MKKRVNKRIDKDFLRWFGHVERMENDRCAKGVYLRKCAGSHSVGRLRKRWIDTIKDCLRKRGLHVRLARKMVDDRREWRGYVRENAWGIARGDEPLTLTRCHSLW